jgi:hypothetical protein
MRILFAAALLAAAPAFADKTSGTVLAFDRVDGVIVLNDKTIWELGSETIVPEDLAAGDIVTLVYQTAGEEGSTKVDSVPRKN